MPTSKPRFMVTVSDEMYKQIENYRFDNRCKSQTQAINELIELGIKRFLTSDGEMHDISDLYTDEAVSDPLTPSESELITIYRDLNDKGQAVLMATAQSLATNPDMKGGSASNTATA